MTTKDYTKYLGKLYALKPSNSLLQSAVGMGVEAFGGEKPWSFLRGSVTLTTDASGIIEFPDDFDGVHTMRHKESAHGGFIQPWPEAEFDYKVPRLDNISGSWPTVCKIYQEDGTWYGQMSAPVSDVSVFVSYKRLLGSVNAVPGKFLSGLTAVCHTFLVKPSDAGYSNAINGKETVVMALWKKDRQVWQTIWKTMDDNESAAFMPWWGTWSW